MSKSKPKWNTKVKCVEVLGIDRTGFEVGKIYDIINSHLVLPNGNESYGAYDCVEKLNECFYAVFEEVVD